MAAPDFRVESGDGTSLGVFVDGDGPPLVMVHGSIADHTTFDDLVAELATTMSIYLEWIVAASAPAATLTPMRSSVSTRT